MKFLATYWPVIIIFGVLAVIVITAFVMEKCFPPEPVEHCDL